MENFDKPQQQVDVNELLTIIGTKEVQIMILSKKVKKLEDELKERESK